MTRIIPPGFYLEQDTVAVAKALLGKVIITRVEGVVTSAVITETEAYGGIVDRASHAWGGRFTDRTRTLYRTGGVAYVYLCYGIHNLFNVVTADEGTPNAVLVRGIKPLEGTDAMLERRGLLHPRKNWVGGPGSASQALGIHRGHDGTVLWGGGPVTLADAGFTLDADSILAGPRVGVDYAGEHAAWPWRFLAKSELFT